MKDVLAFLGVVFVVGYVIPALLGFTFRESQYDREWDDEDDEDDTWPGPPTST